MSETRKFTPQQLALVKEFEVYGIDETDIIFYSEKPEPFFTYEATAMLAQKLTDVRSIDVEPLPAFAAQIVSNNLLGQTVTNKTTAVRCKLGFENEKSCSGVGVVNHDEKFDDKLMNDHQRFSLASARAIRNALKASGINLLKAHNLAKSTGEITAPSEDSLRAKLIAEVHALGYETGFIYRDGLESLNKSAWNNILLKRYGTHSSRLLTNLQLTDFAAFLRSCLQKAA